jgi:hypothetical protein
MGDSWTTDLHFTFLVALEKTCAGRLDLLLVLSGETYTLQRGIYEITPQRRTL